MSGARRAIVMPASNKPKGETGAAANSKPRASGALISSGTISVCSGARSSGHASNRPGAPFVKHTHPGEEILYVLEGSLEYQIEGEPSMT
jgi:quercetin dioxygenase-like cupin family protein